MAGQSYQLTSFYQAYKVWLDCGAPHGEPFSRRFGLCHSIGTYLSFAGVPDVVDDISTCLKIRGEMEQQFDEAGLHWNYPFNSPTHFYNEERIKSEMHLNPQRIAWVNAHA